MDEKQILRNALAFCEQHKSIYTGCVHYKNRKEITRDVIPLAENVLYAIALVMTLSKEKAEQGLKFFERLSAFCTSDGFARYMHDFPQVYSDRPNIEIFLSLSYFLKDFKKLIPARDREKIESIHAKLEKALAKRSLKPLCKMLYETAIFAESISYITPVTFEEYEWVVLCKLLREEQVEFLWHEKLGVYGGPLEGVMYIGHSPVTGLIGQLMGSKESDVSALKGVLLAKRDLKEAVICKQFEREDIFINHDKGEISIHFANHSLVARENVEVVIDKNHIDIILDDFEEAEFFLTDFEQSKIFVDTKKATAFYPSQTISLLAGGKEITLRFSIKKGNFMGHIMKGNRQNQILDCNKNFAIFDHKILLKKTF